MLPNNASDPKQVQVVQAIYDVEEATAHALQMQVQQYCTALVPSSSDLVPSSSNITTRQRERESPGPERQFWSMSDGSDVGRSLPRRSRKVSPSTSSGAPPRSSEVRDCVLMWPSDTDNASYVARVESLESDGRGSVRVCWYYPLRPLRHAECTHHRGKVHRPLFQELHKAGQRRPEDFFY